jgi:hypothetical protein
LEKFAQNFVTIALWKLRELGSIHAVYMLTCTLAKRLALTLKLQKILKHTSHGHLHCPRNLVTKMIFLRVHDIATEFVALEELKRTEENENINEVEVLEGKVFDLSELDRRARNYIRLA